MKREINLLLYHLLCKRKRRQCIILRWHTRRPVKGATVEQVFREFIKIILYAPIRFTMDQDTFSFFDGQLPIHYTWLTPEEQQLVQQIYINRANIFFDKNKLYRCKINPELSIKHRREIIRDFTHCLLTLKRSERNYYMYLLIVICQHLMVEYEKRTDRFIYELHHVLQTNGNLTDLLVTN